MSPWQLNRAILAIERGALFAYPTDTIWGLGCHPLRTAAIERLLRLKRRQAGKGLILLASSMNYCRIFIDADMDEQELERLSQYRSRPTTWIIPATPDCPRWLTGDHSSIAIRITDKPLIKSLCDGLSMPLVSTSINTSGHPPARNRLVVRRQFADQLDFLLNDHGEFNRQAQPSEIRDWRSGRTLRP